MAYGSLSCMATLSRTGFPASEDTSGPLFHTITCSMASSTMGRPSSRPKPGSGAPPASSRATRALPVAAVLRLRVSFSPEKAKTYVINSPPQCGALMETKPSVLRVYRWPLSA